MQRRRSILHVDMNSFYASVEQHLNPALRGRPVVVAGDPDKRNGIVMAKSKEAKLCGVKTAEALWQAKKKCPDLVVCKPQFKLYQDYSRRARAIYYDYSPQIEPFSLDEAWIDITGSYDLFGGSALLIAQEISERTKAELGLRVSIGLSWNKIFAKFGSDEDEGDGIIEITPENYQSFIWPKPVRKLLYVGSATEAKLAQVGIYSIKDLVQSSDGLLYRLLGKMGLKLKCFALGLDNSPVKHFDIQINNNRRLVKSVGNGLTYPCDITNHDEALALLFCLVDSVAGRLREQDMFAQSISVHCRFANLSSQSSQRVLPEASNTSTELYLCAQNLLFRLCPDLKLQPLRALHISAEQIIPSYTLSPKLFSAYDHHERNVRIDEVCDEARARFGNNSITRARQLAFRHTKDLDIKADNIVAPVSFFTKELSCG